MSEFVIHKPAGMSLYRSVQERQHMFGKTWYGLSPNDTYGYGHITYEYKTNKILKFIDFTSMNFYNDYLYKLNSSKSSFKEKINTLYPLGFSDKNVYHTYSQTLKLPIHIQQPALNTLLYSQLYNGRSRCSIGNFDELMSSFLKNKYKDKYDGIIMETSLPNILFNNSQHPEVFIFDEGNVDFVGEIQQIKYGGEEVLDFELPRMQTQIKVNPQLALELKNTTRKFVLDKPSAFSPDEVEYYTNYKYIDELEKEYGVKLPRPADAIVKNEARGGGKYRHTRKRRSHKKE
jgi:hypothetical protein